MKKTLTFLLSALLISSFTIAQQGVGINSDGSQPHASAMLDVKSTTKGFLAPRMTSTERLAIVSPATGLLVYETTSNSIWVYNGTTWVQMGAGGTGGTSPWIVSGNNIYNSNSGFVGIGTDNPLEKLHLQGNFRINNLNPTIQFQQAAVNKGYVQLSGDNLRMGTNAGNSGGSLIIRMDGEERMIINPAGNVGIGTTTPSAKLEVAGAVLLNSGAPALKFRRDGTGSIFGFAYVDFLNSADIVRFRFLENGSKFTMGRPNTFGIHPDLTFNEENGFIGINNADPAVRLDVVGGVKISSGNLLLSDAMLRFLNTNDAKLWDVQYDASLNGLYFKENSANRFVLHNGGNVTFNGSNPTVQLQHSGVNKGFVQLDGDNFRVGTNSSNDLGSFVVRTNGADRFLVDALGVAAFNHNVVMAANAFINGNARAGSLNVGTSLNTPGYVARIGGKLICEEVKVKLISTGWPDYVFSDKYKLPTLQELQAFIEKNKHLPNIPPAFEVEKNGFELGDMQRRVVEKIEELTLYILQLEEKTKKLQERIDILENKANK